MKPKSTSELAFESVIEAHLLRHGYQSLGGASFDRDLALFPEEVLAFIRETQPKVWEKLEQLHGKKTGEQIIRDLAKWMDSHGCLATLRHGFKCYGRTLRVAYFKAAHGSIRNWNNSMRKTACASPASFTTAPEAKTPWMWC
nr:hypothetical protein [Verrucomicrobium spinosum]